MRIGKSIILFLFWAFFFCLGIWNNMKHNIICIRQPRFVKQINPAPFNTRQLMIMCNSTISSFRAFQILSQHNTLQLLNQVRMSHVRQESSHTLYEWTSEWTWKKESSTVNEWATQKTACTEIVCAYVCVLCSFHGISPAHIVALFTFLSSCLLIGWERGVQRMLQSFGVSPLFLTQSLTHSQFSVFQWCRLYYSVNLFFYICLWMNYIFF